METLGISTPTPGSSPVPREKNPGLAFLLSLLLPGAGQLYCGKVKRGIWTLVLCVPAAFGTFSLWGNVEAGGEQFLGILIRLSIFLYGFAFVDAFFTAREITEGIDEEVVENPRVAAILNLLTNGFGYIYLGERRKGILFFIVLGISGRALQQMETGLITFLVAVALEGVVAAMAVDAYRIGNKAIQDRLARWPRPAASVQPEPGLSVSVPVGAAGLLALGYFGLVVVGSFMPDYTKIDQAAASFTEEAGQKRYSNPKYGIEMRIPADWNFDQSDPGYFITAQTMEFGCSVSLIAEGVFPLSSLGSSADSVADQLLTFNSNFRLEERRPATLAGLPAQELLFVADVEGNDVLQSYILARQGFTLYALVTTTAQVFAELCEADMQSIREGIVISE